MNVHTADYAMQQRYLHRPPIIETEGTYLGRDGLDLKVQVLTDNGGRAVGTSSLTGVETVPILSTISFHNKR